MDGNYQPGKSFLRTRFQNKDNTNEKKWVVGVKSLKIASYEKLFLPLRSFAIKYTG